MSKFYTVTESIPSKSQGTILYSRRIKRRKDIKLVQPNEKGVPKGFREECDAAQLPHTRRQLSKFLRKKGLAYSLHDNAGYYKNMGNHAEVAQRNS